ncbi:fibrobacter succinogenes major paralogous domain-containing protein [uncultured Fibrobacter sp.]|uniref:fibrobacter succinogenes major paralogous domain-containing protein n=1 Tax=uncultured Fibrobacter sp. TaxID=261512 RepID=UPI0026349E98|nr:fibrobacter succinogenes major paralogous domain-containing protein [uncultured Fibrobacter sp.]
MTLSKKWKLKTSLRGSFATAAISGLLLLAACGDDSSSSMGTEPVDNPSSSSIVAETLDGEDSSSSVIQSSSSVIRSDSDVDRSSSSSVILGGDEESSNSSSVEQNCSTLLEGKTGWSWDVPKECRLNPDITYGTMTDSRDGQTYKIIKIGDQTWMAENLNYADSINTPSLLERSWCYDDVAANCDVAGRLYTWAAAIDSVKLATDADNPQDCGDGKTCSLPDTVYGICPPGWHLPTDTEWHTLFTEVSGYSIAGMIFKSKTGWDENGNGTDGVGFSALPVGGRGGGGYFGGDGYDAGFWSATEGNDGGTDYMYLLYDNKAAYLNYGIKYHGLSVRCLKD